MNIVFVSLGSKGNATLIQQGSTIIQIDMGVTLKSVKKGLEYLHATPKDISALFITHEHADHIGQLSLYRKLAMPTYAGEGTIEGLTEEYYLHEGEAVDVGEITVLPFCSSHDANNPMNFILLAGGKKFGYVTDTGYIKNNGLALLRDCDYYLMEANYGVKELLEGPYPPFLKRRIHGKKGHLSNIDGAHYLLDLVGEKTKQIFLGHISDENNTPELAEATYREVFAENGKSLEHIKLTAIPQLTLQLGGDLL